MFVLVLVDQRGFADELEPEDAIPSLFEACLDDRCFLRLLRGTESAGGDFDNSDSVGEGDGRADAAKVDAGAGAEVGTECMTCDADRRGPGVRNKGRGGDASGAGES